MADFPDITTDIKVEPLSSLPIAEKPVPGKLETSVEGVDNTQRQAIKVQACLDSIVKLTSGGFKFQQNGVTIVVENTPVELKNENGEVIGIRISAVAYDANGVQLPARDSIHNICNPPFLVPDGTSHEETITDIDGKLKTIKVHNFKEDPLAAFQFFLYSSVVSTARYMGWSEK